MARILDMGVRGGAIGGEILHPKHKNRWRLTFNFKGADARVLQLQAITADRPKLEFEEITLDRYNSRAYIAGKHVFQPINITFEDDLGGGVSKVLQQQLELQQKITGIGPAPMLPAAAAGDRYKFSITMEMMDGDDAVTGTWYIEGAFIQNIDFTDLDYAASETVKITIAVRYDHARMDGNSQQSGFATGGDAGNV